MRPEWWHWHRALLASGLSDGAKVTASEWAGACWNWRQAADDQRRSSPMSLRDLAARRRIPERTTRWHLAQLVEVGLLEVIRPHSRRGPNVYAPRLPRGRRDEPVDSGNPLPVLPENRGKELPVLPPDSGSPLPVFPANSGNETPQQWQPAAIAPFSPEIVQRPPSRAGADAGGRGRAREAFGGAGDEPLSDGQRALRALLARLPEEQAKRVALGWQRQLERRLGDLVARGWSAEQLAARLTERETDSAGSIGGVLVARADEVAAQPSARERSESLAEAAAARGELQDCVHESQCQLCALCRHGARDPAGEVCDRCDHGRPLTRHHEASR